MLGSGAFPHGEIGRVSLVLPHSHSRAGLQFVDLVARELAVLVKLFHGEVDVTFWRFVGITLVQQYLYELNLIGNVATGAG